MKKIAVALIVFALTVPCSYAVKKEFQSVKNQIIFKNAMDFDNYAAVNYVAAGAEVSDPDETDRLFALNVEKLGYLPVLVSVMNNSGGKVLMQGLDAILIVNGEEFRPAPLEEVSFAMQNTSDAGIALAGVANVFAFGMGSGDINSMKSKRNEALRMNVYYKTLQHKLLYPGESAMGYIFYKLDEFDKNQTMSLKLYFQNLERLNYFTVTPQVNMYTGYKEKPAEIDSVNPENPEGF